jgi:RNA polymerase sigma-70 factor (ECF subfamily)
MSFRMASRELSDASLIARCAAGDDGALASLYDRYGRSAYGLALRIVRDPALAEDAVQEGFLAAWRAAPRFDAARAKASTWLLSLVHHKAVDLVRREEARPAQPTAELPETVASDDVSRSALQGFERQRIDAALDRLSTSQREVLVLAYFDGLTQTELADRLGEPLGTIKSRTHAALARLRALLGEDGQAEA